MKFTTETKMANSQYGIVIGNNLKFVVNQEEIWSTRSCSYSWRDTGGLRITGEIWDFCRRDFARMFKMKVAELKKLFKKNALVKVRITIEILEEEEWEYTK